MLGHMMSWEQFYIEHNQEEKWNREKEIDQDVFWRIPELMTHLEDEMILLDNS